MPSSSKRNENTIHVPPHSLEAETSVLGALLLDKDAVIAVAEFLHADHFYDDRHKEIYESIVALYEERAPIDVLTVAERLKKRKSLKRVGGQTYLSELLDRVPSAAHVEHYGKIVKDQSTKRSLMTKATRLVDMSFDESLSAEQMLDNAESEIFSLTQTHLTGSFTPVRTALADSFDRLDELHKLGSGLRGVPTGFKEMDDLLAGLQKSNLVILAARPGVGKCVTGNTLIIDPITGKRNKIDELVNNKQGNILALDKSLKLKKEQPTNFVYDGIKPVYEVVTALGNTIEATAIHPLLTINGWKRLEELSVGDRIASPRKLDFFGNKVWKYYKIKTLAYLLGDGGLTHKSPIFTNKNKRLLSDFSSSVQLFGNVKVRRANFDERTPSLRVSAVDRYFKSLRHDFSVSFKNWLSISKLSQNQLAINIGVSTAAVSLWANGFDIPSGDNQIKLKRVWSDAPQIETRINPVTRWLKELGVMGKLSIDKEIPAEVFELERPLLSLLLNRLYACEGSVILKGLHPRISFASSSYKLAEQVKHLLLRFGILARLRVKHINYLNTKKTAYEVEILNSKDIITFSKEIGIFGKEEKLKKAKIIAESKITTKNWTKDTIPLDVWNLILKEKGERSWREVYQLMHRPTSHNIHVGKRQLRRETLEEIAVALKSEKLSALAKSDIYWDRVISIKPTGKKPVYDLTVDKLHNFVANDIIVHNTSLALNIAQNLAVNHKRSVGMFSLEMSKEELVDRLLTAQADIDAWKLKTGKLNEEDFTALSNAMGELAEAPFYIDDTPALSILEMRTKARRLQVEYGIDLLIIDYLQLARSRNLENRVQEVSEISQGFKNLARELKIPVLALSQLSRSVESRGVKRPQLSDLRESGSIEQDADVVMFLWREEEDDPGPGKPLNVTLDIAKHRNGPLGSIKLSFHGDRIKFFPRDTKHTK